MIKKIAAIVTAVALWWLSIRFSVAGFNIQVSDLVWAGWVLGFAVTVIELVFTSENRGRNKTLVVLGLLAYSYGIWSNTMGIYAARGGGEGLSPVLFTSLVLGLFLEIAPEPLFIWAILGGDTNEGDIVSVFGGLWDDATKRGPGRPKISRFSFLPTTEVAKKPKFTPVDTVSNKKPAPNYYAVTRLSIVAGLQRGNRLIWDKETSQSPTLIDERNKIPVSRSLVRQMVADRTLIEKKNGMIIEYVLTGQEPPVSRFAPR